MEQESSAAVLNTGQLMYSYVDDFCFHGMKVRGSLLDKTLWRFQNVLLMTEVKRLLQAISLR